MFGPIGPMSISTDVTDGESPTQIALQVTGSSRKPGMLQATVSSSMCIIPLVDVRSVLADPSSALLHGCPQICVASVLIPSSPRTSVDGAAGFGGGTAFDRGPHASEAEQIIQRAQERRTSGE